MKIEKKHWKIAIGLAIGVSVFAGVGYLAYIKIRRPKVKSVSSQNDQKPEENGKNEKSNI